MTTHIRIDATDPRAGMTLYELAQAVLTASETGVPDDAHPTVMTGMRGQVRSITFQAPKGEQQ